MIGLSMVSSSSKIVIALASLKNSSSSSEPNLDKPKFIKGKPKARIINQQLKQQQSIIQIERAIGAGSYRDNELEYGSYRENELEDLDQRNTGLDGLLPGGGYNKFESPVEKKLREIGESFAEKSETKFRASGKKILLFSIQWILPIWTLSLLLASGVLKLPFDIPLLDDLIS